MKKSPTTTPEPELSMSMQLTRPPPKSRKKAPEPEILELMDRVAALPTLDSIYAKTSRTKADRDAVIERFRLDRAMYELQQRKKEEKE